jgi:DNA recombination protein RmuC
MPIFAIAVLAFVAGALLSWSIARARQSKLLVQLAVAEQRAELVASNQDQMRDQFRSISTDLLKESTDLLVTTAKSEFEKTNLVARGELEKRQQAIGELVKPINGALTQVVERIQLLDKERSKTAGELIGQMQQLRMTGEQLRGETTGLTRALRQPVGRGQWGEMQLRRVVELAGMLEHTSDFTTQDTVAGDEGRLRPDMVVNMPNGRALVIDSKTPLDAYMDAASEEDEDVAAAHLERHARQVAKHVQDLSRKNYAEHCDGALPDLVVLFLPGEHLFSAAVRVTPTLVDDAYRKGVVIASPTSLLTLLHAVGQGWKEERIAKNAEEISALGRDLYKRISVMARHFAKVGKHLDAATGAYNDTVGSLERNVLSQARKMEKLDAAPAGVDIAVHELAIESARGFTAPELVSTIEGVVA